MMQGRLASSRIQLFCLLNTTQPLYHLGNVGTSTLAPALRTLLGNLFGLTLAHLFVPLILALALMLTHHIGRAVLDKVGLTAQTAPLGQTIGDVHDTLTVEHVAARLEVGLVLIGLEVHKRGEEQDHVAALVHDGGVAERAADLAGKLVLDGLLGRVVPLKVVVAVGEVDVLLVEDSGPLEGCGYKTLVSRKKDEI